MKEFNRNHFDSFIIRLLNKLEVEDLHRNITKIRWKEIITTNLDTLIERAYDEALRQDDKAIQIKTVRNKEQLYSSSLSVNEIKYVKLNGCISDRTYPFVFSTKDFKQTHKYYKYVLSSLVDLSPSVKFLSIGYSFSDDFSKKLLEKFDSFNFRNRKWIFNVDPYVNENRLEFYEENHIAIINVSAAAFFELYNEWLDKHASTLAKRKNITFKDVENNSILLKKDYVFGLMDNIIELSNSTSSIRFVEQEAFYKGEKPTYDVVRKNYDVIKASKLNEISNKVGKILNAVDTLIPVIFLKGNFGTGKSTFTYRVIHNILEADNEVKAYEIIDPSGLSVQVLGELFRLSKAKRIILLCNELEVDSSYKRLIELRNRLNHEQFSDINIMILSSIRENIFEKHMKNYQYKEFYSFEIDSRLNTEEAKDLVEKLNEIGVINYRDAKQKGAYIHEILNTYDGDTFISLISLVGGSPFSQTVLDALSQISKKAIDAIIYTSLVYQYGILMPASVLMKVISHNWDDFDKEILKYDGKNILIQEIRNPKAVEADLFLRIRHSIIARKIIDLKLRTNDKIYDAIKKIVSSLYNSPTNSKFIIDLLKAIRDNKTLTIDKINHLFDIAHKGFNDNPYFIIYYAINLQHREDELSLLKAEEALLSCDSGNNRNHRVIHRRGAVCFDLGKFYFNNKNYTKSEHYIEEALELFDIKLREDPSSSYSYYDFIKLRFWILNNTSENESDRMRNHYLIQNLIDEAEDNLFDNIDKINEIKLKYYQSFDVYNDKYKALQYLDEMYNSEKEERRVLALILKYNLFLREELDDEAITVIEELEYYKEYDEVKKILFKYYGINLHIVELRTKFYELVNNTTYFETKESFKYHYYSYVAACYSRRFYDVDKHLDAMSNIFYHFNPNIEEKWIDINNNEPYIFKGMFIKNTKGKFLIKIPELQKAFLIRKFDFTKIKPLENGVCDCHLAFTISGIRAEIIKQS